MEQETPLDTSSLSGLNQSSKHANPRSTRGYPPPFARNSMPYTDKDQQRAFQKKWMSDRRKRWLQLHGPCACGSWDLLEVHHVDPAKKVDHKVWSWSKKRRDEELAKCVALCHECHQEETSARLRKPITHGTASGYRRGCRCEACTKLHSQKLKEWHRAKASN